MKKYILLTFAFVCFAILNAQEIEFGEVSKAELEEKQHPQDSEAAAAILYENIYVTFRYIQGQGFQVETNVHKRIKIYTKDGFDMANHSIPLYKGGSEREKVETISFNTIISENNLSHIDFLKLDCEGGEYDVFSEDNVPFLLTVPKIVTEFHLHGNIGKAKFREFRDIFLKAFPNHEVYSIDGVNIKWDLWNEHFLEYYQEILIYIDNIFKNCCKFII